MATDALSVSAAPAALVVGAGVAGLVAARELAVAGYAVTVLEAGTAGGRVGAHEVDGLRLDTGAEAFATRTDAVARLAAELDLAPVYPAPAGAWLHAGDGADLPLPSSGIVGIPGDPTAPEVLTALGEEGAARAAQDLTAPVDPALLSGPLSLGALVRDRLGDAALEVLVAPVVSGVHSADPDQLDVDVIAPGLRAGLERTGSLCRAAAALRSAAPSGSAVAGLPGGMNTLVSALLADLTERGVRLRERSRVTSVRRTLPDAAGSPAAGTAPAAAGPEAPDAAWTVSVRGALTAQDGEDEADEDLQAERLVVATDGPTAVDLLSEAVPGLSELRPAEGAGIALATLVVDAPDLDAAPRGSGVLVSPSATDVRAKALTHATAKWPWLAEEAGPGRHVLRLSYGRITDATPVAGTPDEELIAAAVTDAATLLGVPLSRRDVLDADVIRHPGALPMATLGHRATLRAITEALAAVPELDVIGAWRSGTGLAAVVEQARTSARTSAQ